MPLQSNYFIDLTVYYALELSISASAWQYNHSFPTEFFDGVKFAGADRLRSNGRSKRELALPKDGLPGGNIAAQIFTFRELAAATKNFRPESFLGEGGFGRVYKGRLESTGQVNSLDSFNSIHFPFHL